MQSLKNYLVLLFLIFAVSLTAQKKYSAEDYNVLNEFLSYYQDTIFHPNKEIFPDGIVRIYRDTIYLDKNVDRKFNTDFITLLRYNQQRFREFNNECEMGPCRESDINIGYMSPCDLRKPYAQYYGLVTADEEEALRTIAKQPKEHYILEGNKLSNPKMHLITSEKFKDWKNPQKNGVVIGFSKPRVKIRNLTYSKDRDLAFIEVYEQGSYSSGDRSMKIYKKVNGKWQFFVALYDNFTGIIE